MKEPWSGKVYSTITYISNYVILSILFYIFSIPLFTIGASISALHKTREDIETDSFSRISVDYFKNFKQYFRISTKLFLFFSIFISLIALVLFFTPVRNYPIFLLMIFFLLTVLLLMFFISNQVIINNNLSIRNLLLETFKIVNIRTINVVIAFTTGLALLSIPLFFPKLLILILLTYPALMSKLQFKLIFKE